MPLVKTQRGPIWYANHRRDPERMPSLLIHGAGATHNDWSKELRKMPELNAIVPDLPGHGKSPQPGGRTSVTDYATDMIALLDAVEINQVIVAGHSMGGAIAQTIALQDPSRVMGLILFNTGAKLSVNPAILDGIIRDPLATARMMMKWLWATGTPQDVLDCGVQRLLEIPSDVIHGDYTACDGFDVQDQLNQISVPTLIVAGAMDRMTPPTLSEYMATHIPDSELVVIENGGHMMMLEQPAIVAETVQNWFQKRIS